MKGEHKGNRPVETDMASASSATSYISPVVSHWAAVTRMNPRGCSLGMGSFWVKETGKMDWNDQLLPQPTFTGLLPGDRMPVLEQSSRMLSRLHLSLGDVFQLREKLS